MRHTHTEKKKTYYLHTLHCTTLHYITLQYVALDYIGLLYYTRFVRYQIIILQFHQSCIILHYIKGNVPTQAIPHHGHRSPTTGAAVVGWVSSPKDPFQRIGVKGKSKADTMDFSMEISETFLYFFPDKESSDSSGCSSPRKYSAW